MILRASIALGVLVAVGIAVALWHRPPRRLTRLDLPSLGIEGPAIVQFAADFCAPCRQAAPHLQRTARETGIAYRQVDVGQRTDVARAYGIRTVPTIAVARPDGRVLEVWTALPERRELTEAATRARGG